MKKSEITSRINACKQELAQNDFTARKILHELIETLLVLNPSMELPIYNKYKAMEAQAKARRAEINELEELYPTAEDDEGI